MILSVISKSALTGCVAGGDPVVTVTIAGEDLTLYRLEEVAQMLGVRQLDTVRGYLRRAGVRTVLIDRHKMVPAGELRRFLTATDRRPRAYAPHLDTPQDPEDEDLWSNEETLL